MIRHRKNAMTKLTSTQRNQLIAKAILEAITAGNGAWGTGIVPAVSALNITKSGDGLKVRSCLQALMDKGLVYRKSFTADEVYDLTKHKAARVVPAGGYTIHHAFENGDFIHEISIAHCAVYEGEALPETATCSVTGLVVFLMADGGRFSVTVQDGTDVTELFNQALSKSVGM
jgi:hypothetical protein